MIITLSGGPLAGLEVNDSGWEVGARRYFTLPDATECTYWRYDNATAVFEGLGRIE